ncbi:MAG: recombinase family protein [Bacilli bacterium]
MNDTKEKIKTAVYLRVSTEDQAKEGFSIAAQKEKLTKYVEVNDWKLYDYFIDDGISGKNIKDRPELTKLIELVKKKEINNVLIYKLDRLTRSVKDLINLIELFEQYDCNFSSVTEKLDTSNAVGRMFIKIIGIFAEFERENLAERVSFGYEEKTRQGNYTNTNGVYGYDYIIGKGDLVINEKEAELVKQTYENYLSGKAMISIAKDYNLKKIPTKRGGDWSQSTIQSILTNNTYLGKVRYGVNKKIRNKAFIVESNHKPIIDEYTFKKVQNMRKKRKHFNIKKFPSENAYFGLVLKCSHCGARFHAKQQSHNSKLYITYYCNNKQTARCECRGISHIKVLTVFEDYIKDIKLDCNVESNTNNKNDKKLDKLNKELAKLEAKRKRIQKLFINEDIETTDYKEMLQDISTQKKQIISSINDLNQEQETVIDYSHFKNILNNIKLNWEHLDISQKNSFINQFIDSIILDVNNGKPIIKELNFC